MKISEQELEAVSKYILKISGIYLDQSKSYLVETRLRDLIVECQASSYTDFIDKVKADRSQKLKNKLIDAISTNETYFFRDNVPFDLLRNKIVPDLIDLKRKRNSSGVIPLRIWSAASSTGQEVYSIVITLLEMLEGMGKFDIFVQGTDISNEAIAHASYGAYTQFEVQRGLPEKVRKKYFLPQGDKWRIKDHIRSMVKFEKINLLQPFSSSLGTFDIVFCRNVAIYFKRLDKLNLFRRISKVINSGGCLIVGGSENLSGIAPDFVNKQYLRGNYYTLEKDNVSSKSASAASASSLRKSVNSKSISKTVYDKRTGSSTKRNLIQSLRNNEAPSEKISKEKSSEALSGLKPKKAIPSSERSTPESTISNSIEKIPETRTNKEPEKKSAIVSLHSSKKNGEGIQKKSLLASIHSKDHNSGSLLSQKTKGAQRGPGWKH